MCIFTAHKNLHKIWIKLSILAFLNNFEEKYLSKWKNGKLSLNITTNKTLLNENDKLLKIVFLHLPFVQKVGEIDP